MADDIEPTGTDETVLPLQEIGGVEEDDVLAHSSHVSLAFCLTEPA
ncbi:hypothetical protein OG599_00115 [Streptomyces sp. NBC_01335]|nr:hypothetical protein OG599_00115 [Streptomyces sp. NBC_01335]